MIQAHHCENRVLYPPNMFYWVCKIDGRRCDKYDGRNNSPECPLMEDTTE